MAIDLTPLLAIAAVCLMGLGGYLVGLHVGRTN